MITHRNLLIRMDRWGAHLLLCIVTLLGASAPAFALVYDPVPGSHGAYPNGASVEQQTFDLGSYVQNKGIVDVGYQLTSGRQQGAWWGGGGNNGATMYGDIDAETYSIGLRVNTNLSPGRYRVGVFSVEGDNGTGYGTITSYNIYVTITAEETWTPYDNMTRDWYDTSDWSPDPATVDAGVAFTQRKQQLQDWEKGEISPAGVKRNQVPYNKSQELTRPATGTKEPEEKWTAYDVLVRNWYDISDWSPDPSTIDEGVRFTQRKQQLQDWERGEVSSKTGDKRNKESYNKSQELSREATGTKPLPIVLALTSTVPTECCTFDSETASFSVRVTGGKAPFRYTWAVDSRTVLGDSADNGVTVTMAGGNHTLTVTVVGSDGDSKQAETPFAMPSPPTPLPTATVTSLQSSPPVVGDRMTLRLVLTRQD